MIRNSELAGLTDREIEIIAQIARYHRKSEPKQSHASSPRWRRTTSASCARSPASCAWRSASTGATRAGSRRARRDRRPATLVVTALAADGADIGLELYAANERKALLERVLDCHVELVAGLPAR